MDSAKRKELIERIKQRGLPSPDRPMPLVTLEEFFVGNDDYGSIGCNLTPMLGPRFFFERLKFILSQANVQDVLVEVAEVVEEDPATWPSRPVFTSSQMEQPRMSNIGLRPSSPIPLRKASLMDGLTAPPN
jgi:hypothetical protein